MITEQWPSFAGEKKFLGKLGGYYRSMTEIRPSFESYHKT